MFEYDVEVVGLREVLYDLHDVRVVELLQDLHLLVGLEEIHVFVHGEDLADALDATVAFEHLPDNGPAPPKHLGEVV